MASLYPSLLMAIRALHDEILTANRAYRDFPRHDGDAWDILALKVESAYWRHRMLDRLLAAGEAGGDKEELTEALLALNLHLNPPDLDRLRGVVGDGELYGRVAAQQGIRWPETPHLHTLAGPGLDLKIQANRASPWSREKWQKIPEFSEYAFEGDTLRYRGMELQAGDIILASVNLDGNMVYSALSDPKGVFTHSAMLVFFRQGDRRFPAVMETYEKGVRAVPLAVFLNARFLAHAEVYRHKGVGPEHADALADAAEAMARDTLGYNCASWDDDREYLSCTAVGRFLLEAVGVDGIGPRSAIAHPQVVKNLNRVGFLTLDPFFAPVDYLLNPNVRFVGVVDNNQVHRLLAREVVERRFRTEFEKVDLDPSLLPLEGRVNHFAIRQIRAQNLIGKLVGKAIGFDDRNLPKGPDHMLGSIQPVEHQFGKAVKALIPGVQRYLDGKPSFRLQELLDDPTLLADVRKALSPRWLVP